MIHGLTQTVAPLSAPVSLEEARQQCGLRAGSTAYDAALTSYIDAATEYVGSMLGRAFITSQYTFTRDGFVTEDYPALFLPLSPLASVEQVQYLLDGQLTPFTDYDVITDREPGYLFPTGTWPAADAHPQSVQVSFTAGAAAAEPNHKQLILIVTCHYFENRAPVSNPGLVEIPLSMRTLIYNSRTGAEFKCY